MLSEAGCIPVKPVVFQSVTVLCDSPSDSEAHCCGPANARSLTFNPSEFKSCLNLNSLCCLTVEQWNKISFSVASQAPSKLDSLYMMPFVMNAMTSEDYKETYWPRLEKAVEQLLTQSPVKYSSISYEQIYSGYAPQVGCELEEKERFWSELDEVMESIPTGERVVIGADFNGHVGEGNTGDEEVVGKFGVKERNLEGQMVVDFAKRMDMGVVNTYFQKREEHRVTYKSGGRSTQVDYILCRRGNLKEISDCKVVVGESVARQHRMVVCRMTLMVRKKKRSEIEKKTKWWKLKKEECCEEFRQKLRQALGGQVVLPDDWETTAEVIRETGRKVLGVSSGRRKEDKETWWWNEEVQDSIQRKRLAKKKWDMDRTEENRQEYKELQRRVKREVSKAKQKAYEELYTRLDTREGEKDLYRLARQRDRDGKDVQQKVDKIRKDEVRKALKTMKSGKAVGPDDILVEVWKCLGEAAVEFLASLFNRVLESERMPEEWRRNLEKAYDRVPREELWYCMRKSGVAEEYVRVVQDMYERSRTVVRCAVGQTEEFKVEVGLHQGSALSPFLFAIVMDQLSEEVRQESPWTMMFADDIVICSESREQVEENLERWSHVYKCVCQQYSEHLYKDLLWKITSHLQQVCLELQDSQPESFVENFNLAFTQYMAAIQCIIPVFIYMNKFYIEIKLNRDLKDDLMDLFSAHVAEKHISMLISLLKKADSMPFQVKPSTMASVVKGLYDLQPDWAQLAPAVFSRFIPQIHPPVLESDLLRYTAEDQKLQMELSLNGFPRCNHSRKRPSEES
ncbi:hypothetical protein QTP86_028181 [Hemibagrus guttatus]|nr:hypothetical protein QTP86_028181 [Hemibagrus guttatus]